MNTKALYSPSEANERISAGNTVIIDVRDTEDYATGHIPGAVNIPEMFTTLSMTSPEGLREMENIFTPLFRAAGVRPGATVIVYEDCLHTRYGGSCRGYFQLQLLGHEDVGILDGGLAQWVKDGFPLTTEASSPVASDFQPRLQTGLLATCRKTAGQSRRGRMERSQFITLWCRFCAAQGPYPGLPLD